MAWTNGDWYEVGVYWPQEGDYGIPSTVHTLAQAAEKIEVLNRAGYGVGGSHPSEIHVRRVQVNLIPLSEIPLAVTNFRCADCGFEGEITDSAIASHRKDCRTGTTEPLGRKTAQPEG